MSLDASTIRFFEDIQLDGSAETWIDKHLRNELPRLISKDPWPSGPTGCLLADFGNYLVRVLRIVTTFAAEVLQSDFISNYVDARMEDLAAQDDLRLANFLDDKHAAIKQIATNLNHALGKCERSWSFTLSTQSPATRFQEPTFSNSQQQASRASYSDRSSDIRMPAPLSPYSSSHRASSGNQHVFDEDTTVASASNPQTSDAFASGEDQSYTFNSTPFGSNDREYAVSNSNWPSDNVPSIEQLRSRGKGHYSCPHGYGCKKGGVQPNGELTVFERNSGFRAHLQLHERNYKCDLPGCPNTRGFARIDQLERHKKTVKHNAPGWVHEDPP